MVGLHEEFGRIGERFVPGEPSRLGMTVRTDEGQAPHLLIQRPRDFSHYRLNGEQTIGMVQHDSCFI